MKNRDRLPVPALIFTICFISLISVSQITGAIPRTYVKNASFDFGTVSEGKEVIHDFIINNKGQDDLAIESIYTG